MLYFELIKNNLRSIHLQTQMLEACGWDEDYLAVQLEIVSQYFENYTPATGSTWNDVLLDCRLYMKNNLGDSLGSIIIDVLEHNKKEIVDIMNLEEN